MFDIKKCYELTLIAFLFIIKCKNYIKYIILVLLIIIIVVK